jgi:hypothetical protein
MVAAYALKIMLLVWGLPRVDDFITYNATREEKERSKAIKG